MDWCFLYLTYQNRPVGVCPSPYINVFSTSYCKFMLSRKAVFPRQNSSVAGEGLVEGRLR